jgi:transcriptional regulator with XRE-family HTH domain
MEDQRKKVSLMLKQMRIQRGYTQTELAERLGISQARITEVESGRVNLSIDKLELFALGLNCVLDISITPR